MACLEDVTVGSSVIGIAGNAPVIVVAVKWSFDLAVHTSTIEPLPHQISAVYQEMLPRLPLRYILADDPEEKVADQASAASTISELEAEILMLKKLERMANDVRASGKDRKWDELSQLLQDNENMFGTEGAREKLIIFTEHRDTLRYLIGQTEVCHLWNLVSIETREGMVFQRLFEKLEQEREALKGKVFDILGKVTFNNKPLRELLIEAVRYGNDPSVRARLYNEILTALNKPEEYILAVVEVDEAEAQTVYLKHPFKERPDFAATSVNYNIAELVDASEVILKKRRNTK